VVVGAVAVVAMVVVGAVVVGADVVVVEISIQASKSNSAWVTNPESLRVNQPQVRSFVTGSRGHLHRMEKVSG
jgi:hypothetical protein